VAEATTIVVAKSKNLDVVAEIVVVVFNISLEPRKCYF